jgi:hypothetical protein
LGPIGVLASQLTLALGRLVAPLSLPRALLLRLPVHPKVLLAGVFDEAADGRRAIEQLHRALGYLGRGATIDVTTLRRFTRPLAANVARQDLQY